MHVCYAKIRALVRNIWNPEMWDKDIWVDITKDYGSEDTPEHSEPFKSSQP